MHGVDRPLFEQALIEATMLQMNCLLSVGIDGTLNGKTVKRCQLPEEHLINNDRGEKHRNFHKDLGILGRSLVQIDHTLF